MIRPNRLPKPQSECGRVPTVLPTNPTERKEIPVATGCLDYFPNALAEVAKISKAGNDQHNPGQPLHWERGKSTDHADTIIRHLMERGTIDVDGKRHTAKAAWRVLALLQEELERDEGVPVSRGSWPALVCVDIDDNIKIGGTD